MGKIFTTHTENNYKFLELLETLVEGKKQDVLSEKFESYKHLNRILSPTTKRSLGNLRSAARQSELRKNKGMMFRHNKD